MNEKTKTPQLPLPIEMPAPPFNVGLEIRIEGLVTKLTGEVQTLKKCWQLSQLWQEEDALSNLDTLATAELTASELWGTGNHIMSMCDQLKALTNISMAYYSTLRGEGLDDFVISDVMEQLDRMS